MRGVHPYMWMRPCVCQADSPTYFRTEPPNLETAYEMEPPVGFEPTTSRLLSGCSAN